MTAKLLLPLLLLTAPALGGCAVQAAMAAAEIAPQLKGPLGPSNAHLKPTATAACTQRAAPYGSVYIVDVAQPRRDRILIWGSVTDPQQQRRTFECHFTNRVTTFRVHEIR
jgi:hypothetical protein